MLTDDILKLVATQPLTSPEIIQKLNLKKSTGIVTLNYLFKRGKLQRELKDREIKTTRGRQTLYVYRISSC